MDYLAGYPVSGQARYPVSGQARYPDPAKLLAGYPAKSVAGTTLVWIRFISASRFRVAKNSQNHGEFPRK